MTPNPIKVLVVDDHAMVRGGLMALIRQADGMEPIGEAETGRQAVETCMASNPHVVLMDLAMPGMDGVAATAAIKLAQPHIKVVVLTTFGQPDQITAALDAGADGYLLKDVAPAELVSGIRSVVAGGVPLSPHVAAAVVRRQLPAQIPQLSLREKQVLGLLVTGSSNKQIARELCISEKTVKAHFGRIFQRIGVRDRTQAALWAATHLFGQQVQPVPGAVQPVPVT